MRLTTAAIYYDHEGLIIIGTEAEKKNEIYTTPLDGYICLVKELSLTASKNVEENLELLQQGREEDSEVFFKE